MTDWNIQARAHACTVCDQPFSDRQPLHTLLFDEHAENLRRLDVCEACWQNQFSDGARQRKGFISHWQSVYESPPPEPIHRENAESLLRKLAEQNDARYAPVMFILAVMLERKRVFIYEQPKTGDVFTIADPALRLDQLEQVQRDVAALLEHGLNPPASVDESASTQQAPAADNETASQPAEQPAGN